MARPVTVNHIVTEAMYKYDHNKSGAIDLTRPDGFINKLKNPDERARSTTSAYSLDGGDTLTISSQVYTMRDLFYAADKNGDKKVTREELEAEVKKFDTNGDGELLTRGFFGWLTRKPKLELDKFNDHYKERTTAYGSIDI